MIEYIVAIIIVFIVGAACCSSDDSTSKNTSRNTNQNTYRNRNTSYRRSSYSECPSCGASGFDGYCDECGYPDVNLGWVGENY